MPVDLLRYTPGGAHFTLVYVWKVDGSRSSSEETSQAVHMFEKLEKLRPQLPKFHTQAMKASFKEQFGRLSRITPSVLEAVYQKLSLDDSALSNPAVGDV